MRRLALSLTVLVMFTAASLATMVRPAGAQGVFDAVKKKADAAKKAADEIKRKADSTNAAAAKAKASADSAKLAAEGAKASVEGAAKTITSTGGAAPASAPQRDASARSGSAASPAAAKSGRATGVAASSAGASPGLSRTAAHVDEQVVFVADAGTPFAISHSGQHVAGRTLKGSRTVMVYDGVAGPPFDEIPGIAVDPSPGGAFSDDGNHYAYVARQGQQWVVMEDGKEVARGGPFSQNSGNATMASMGFTPGGKHLYFTIADIDHNKFQLYFDGKPDPVIQDPVLPVLSPDGEHYAYVFSVNKETGHPLPALMVDGKRAAYAGDDPRFTADGLHLYTRMTVPGTSVIDVLLDGKPFMRVPAVQLHFAPSGSAMLATVLAIGPKGERSTFLTIGNKRVPNSDCHGSAGADGVYFSADVKHWAVRCQDSNTSYWIMTDGKKGQEYQHVASDVTFTSDGRPVYLASANSKYFVIAGDQEFGPYASVVPQAPPGVNNLGGVAPIPILVAGNHFGFIAMESNAAGLNRVVVVDGKVTKAVDASNLGFSSDGSHFAYVEGQGSRAVVLDGTQRFGVPFAHDNDDVPAAFVFSSDGKHLAFASASPGGRAVAIDDGMFVTDAVRHSDITFTPDGRHLVWLGTHSGNRRRVYVDGLPVLECDQPAGAQQSAETWWSMGADGVLTLIAQDGGELKRFRVAPGSSSVDARSRR
jgi:hypothetical protein